MGIAFLSIIGSGGSTENANLLDGVEFAEGYYTSGNNIATSSTSSYPIYEDVYLPVEPSTTYSLLATATTKTCDWTAYVQYSDNSGTVAKSRITGSYATQFTTTSDANYIRISFRAYQQTTYALLAKTSELANARFVKIEYPG